MRVYIKAIDNFPMFDWGVDSLMGFRMKGTDINFFENIEEVPLNRNSLVVSDIKDTRWFFKEMGWSVRENMTFPYELNHCKFWKRNIFVKKGYEITPGKQFVKPYDKLKSFDPFIFEKNDDLKNIPDINQKVVCSEVVDFMSEYRCYIIDKKIVGCLNYLGDIYKYPNLKLVDDIIKTYKDAPMGYSIDVGILNNGETALVELNDGWSLGNYGLNPKIYSRLLAERWIEILKQNPVKI